MSVESYSVSLLELDSCPLQIQPSALIEILKAWRRGHKFTDSCSVCKRELEFAPPAAWVVCCNTFYYDGKAYCYPVRSIAVPSPAYEFALPQLKRMLKKANIVTDQEFLVLPDPVYWQVATTLVYEKVMKFISGLPVTSRADTVLPPEKANQFYKQIQEAPLNYGSMQRRNCGKSMYIRQVSFGKRVSLSMRGMIVPDASLRPNEIRMPEKIVKQFGIAGQWILLNRMPSLQPGNFVALVARSWPFDCFGIPLEIVEAMNADFDGDECNVYLVPNVQSQAECATILNPQSQMGSFVTGLKLSPSQDMLSAYHLFYDEIDFLPYKNRDLKKTMQVIYDLHGSEVSFECFDRMRKFYLEAFQKKRCFALTLREMEKLAQLDPEEFEKLALQNKEDCLAAQVLSGAKGSIEHLYQMFARVGWQNGVEVRHSFWQGLDPVEFVAHAITANEALKKSGKIWEPGYGYSKAVRNLQGLHVDYKGRLVDGTLAVEKDVLNVLHHTDLMSEEAFEHLVTTTLLPED